MTARMRRLASDWEQIRKDFAGHKNIIVTPVGEEPPEKYHVTYFVNGIYLLPDGRIETQGRHEVEITLHSDYPRYKPICKILTPIWHPNFRDGQICIGDIWGAGESLTDIIINIGDMIQYRSWNSYSPLSADAAQWAMENKHLFPVGNIDLFIADYASAKDTVEIDLFDEEAPAAEEPAAGETAVLAEAGETAVLQPAQAGETAVLAEAPAVAEEPEDGNDFEITAEELAGIEFVPTAQRMQSVSHGAMAKGGINIKTIIVKGLLWALIGSILGFMLSEVSSVTIGKHSLLAWVTGSRNLVEYYQYEEKADKVMDKINMQYYLWCIKNLKNPNDEDNFGIWLDSDDLSKKTQEHISQYLEYDELSTDALNAAYNYDFDGDEDTMTFILRLMTCLSTALWSAVVAMVIGLALGIGEGVFYGSFLKALIYGAIGAVVSMIIGAISGCLAQLMFSFVNSIFEDPIILVSAFIRGVAWGLMGLGIGMAAGLIKPAFKRIIFCTIGGTIGGFAGGFLFDFVCEIVPFDVAARLVGVVIMGILIGLGVGLLEQFAKQAWLKVIRGEFEGKEYLVFSGTTSIGNNATNTIVLFKDKLVGPHHCDIKLEGNRYILSDCGTPLGTVVNGRKITKHTLRKGDAISIGNSVLVFNTK